MAKKPASDKGFSFHSQKEFETWLSKNYSKSDGIWVCLYKKDAGVQAITGPELIDALLCYGWITGPAKKGNERYVLWWVCPRKKNSSWSAVNIAHAERLIQSKKMMPPGMAAIETAKAEGQWRH